MCWADADCKILDIIIVYKARLCTRINVKQTANIYT